MAGVRSVHYRLIKEFRSVSRFHADRGQHHTRAVAYHTRSTRITPIYLFVLTLKLLAEPDLCYSALIWIRTVARYNHIRFIFITGCKKDGYSQSV